MAELGEDFLVLYNKLVKMADSESMFIPKVSYVTYNK